MKLLHTTAAALALLAASPASAGDCARYQQARDHIYAVLGGPIMPELQAKGVQSKERLNMAMAALNVQYRDEIAAGDKFAPLKMVGLRVFLLPFMGDTVDANTRKNTCDMVAADPASKIMLPPDISFDLKTVNDIAEWTNLDRVAKHWIATGGVNDTAILASVGLRGYLKSSLYIQ